MSLSIMPLLSLFDCSSDAQNGPISDKDWSRADRVVYSFRDSSLPPDYHRSYELVVTPTIASIFVHSYGKELLKESYKVTPEQFQKVITALRGMDIRSRKANRNAIPCSGGTTNSFAMSAGDELLFSGFVDNCEDQLSTMSCKGNLLAAFAIAFPQPVESLVDKTRPDHNVPNNIIEEEP